MICSEIKWAILVEYWNKKQCILLHWNLWNHETIKSTALREEKLGIKSKRKKCPLSVYITDKLEIKRVYILSDVTLKIWYLCNSPKT